MLRRLLLVLVIATGAPQSSLAKTPPGHEARCKGGAVLSAARATFLKQSGDFNMYMDAGAQAVKDALRDTMCHDSVVQRPNAESAKLTVICNST
jgi:hypothetical protein